MSKALIGTLPTKAVKATREARDLARQMKSIREITSQGLAIARGMLKNVGEPGYNTDADRPFAEATVKTRFAMRIYENAKADQREHHVTERTLGAIVLRERLQAKDWEAHAKEVDESERQKRAIDVVAEEVAAK